jgi:hypothetical protein
MVAGPVTGLEWSEPMKQAQSVLANIQPQIDHQPDHTTEPAPLFLQSVTSFEPRERIVNSLHHPGFGPVLLVCWRKGPHHLFSLTALKLKCNECICDWNSMYPETIKVMRQRMGRKSLAVCQLDMAKNNS